MAVTDWKAPTTAANVDRDGKVYWLDPDNAMDDDADYAVGSPEKNTYSDWLRLTNFDFSAIPSGATINGIELQYKRDATNANDICDSALYLRKTSGQIGDNKASATKYATSKETVTYGGASDLWGYAWTQSDIVSANFGVDLSVLETQNLVTSCNIYYCQIRVYYTAAVTFQPWAIIM